MAVRESLAELTRALVGVVGEQRVSTRTVDRATYARDMWPRLLLAVRGGAPAEHPPDVVVWPETVDEVRDIVAVAKRFGAPIVPYGAGSGVCGGAVPIRGGITVDVKRMDRVTAIDAEALTVTAEAGINGERLERALAARGLTLGHFPSSIYCSTLGGWLAARSAGQMSTKYGKIEDMVLSVTAVTGRGEVMTTGAHGRAATGPDFTQLLVGSEGTLGIITSARLRIRPAPEARHLRGFEFARVPAGLEGIRRVLQRGLRPAVVRLYDEFDSWMALRQTHGKNPKHEPDPKALMGALPSLEGDAAEVDDDDGLLERLRALLPGRGRGGRLKREVLAAALDRPRMLNRLVEVAAPRVGRRGCLLIVGVEGSAARADVESRLVFAELERAGGKDLGEEPGQRWLARRYAVSYNLSKMYDAGAFVDTMEVASTWERLIDLYDGVRHAIGKHAFVMAHFSHAYPEGCSIYFSFAGHGANRQAEETKYDALWRDGLGAASRAGGTISHHHGVGLMKGPYMAEEHRDSMALYQGLKLVLDPEGVMNPGKMGLPDEPVPPVQPLSDGGDLPGLGARLAAVVGATHVTQAPRDLSAVGVSTLPAAQPAWLVRPGSPAEVSAVVRAAAEAGAVVVPVGTATRRPRKELEGRPRVVVDVKRLAHVLHLDETSLTVQAQTGLTGLALEEMLLPRGLTMGDYPPAVLRSTLGGMLSVRTPGKGSPRHGQLEDAVLGVSAVLADGRAVHTRVAPRRATGPDLGRVLLGAEGGLGILTAVTLRIHRRPEARLLDSARFPGVGDAVAAVYAALRADARPAAVRVYDGREARAHLAGDVCAAGEAILVLGTAGPPELAAADRELFATAARAHGGVGLGPGPAERWWRRRYGHAVAGPNPPLPALEIFADSLRLAGVHEVVVEAAAAAGRTARAHIARFDADGACLFVTLLDGDRPDPTGPARAAVEAAALQAGGHLVGTRDPALAAASDALKRTLDPTGVFGATG